MWRRRLRGMLVTAVAGFAVAMSMHTVVKPFTAVLKAPSIAIELGAVRIEVEF